MIADNDSWWLDELAYAGRENLDEQHVRRYDNKMDAAAGDEVRMLQESGAVGPTSTVVDMGAGTGQFALAVAGLCQRVVAVDVSPVMLAALAQKIEHAGANNIEATRAGFLSYEHSGTPADLVYSRFALHHLPDFWKAVALSRVAAMLRPGGIMRLSDVVYAFEAFEADRRIEAWIEEVVSDDVESGWTRAEVAEHVRDEHSTFTWLLEPMIEHAGFEIVEVTYSASGMLAQYRCHKR